MIICEDVDGYNDGEEIKIRVRSNTEEEIIEEIKKEIERRSGEIITEGMKRMIRIIRDMKEGEKEKVIVRMREAKIYKIEIEGIRIRCIDKDIVMEIKEIVEKKKGKRGIIKYGEEIMDVNYTMDRYLESEKIKRIEFIEIEEYREEEIKRIEMEEIKSIIKKEKREKNEKKEKIPRAVKNALWNKWYKNALGVCYCCKNELHYTNFDCGHIISEYNGGRVHIENLRPICRTCNSSMGRMNMDEFMNKYGL